MRAALDDSRRAFGQGLYMSLHLFLSPTIRETREGSCTFKRDARIPAYLDFPLPWKGIELYPILWKRENIFVKYKLLIKWKKNMYYI